MRLVNSSFCSSFNNPNGNSVKKGPGEMQFTVTPYGPRSNALERAMPIRAAFVALYTFRPNFPPSPSTDEI